MICIKFAWINRTVLQDRFYSYDSSKNDKSILGTSYKFVRIASNKKKGIIHNGYGNLPYPITDVEKTIIDCFDLPQHSVGCAELIRAVSQAQMQASKLIEHCQAVNKISITKRIGYLVEFLQITVMDPFIDFAKKQVKNRYNLFEPQGLDEGEFVAEWLLRLNISREEFLDISNKQYEMILKKELEKKALEHRKWYLKDSNLPV